MKQISTRNWINVDQNYALLFFSQLIDELLFHYTIDSFKLPAHNIRTLVSEAKKTIEYIDNGILKEGSFEAIKKELIDLVSKDEAFKILLQENIEISVNLLNQNKIQETKKLLDYLSINLKNDYYKTTISIIKSKIQTNDTSDLIRLTKNLLIELLNKGYSLEYINIINRNVFQKKKVESIASFDEFINEFNFENKQFFTIFKCSKKYLNFQSVFNNEFISASETLDPDVKISTKIDEFTKKEGIFIRVSSEARDPYQAFYKSRHLIDMIASHFSFIQHKHDYGVSIDGIIYNNEDSIYFYGKNNPILRRPDIIKDHRILDKLQVIMKTVLSQNLDENSNQRISLAYFQHQNSLRSASYKNQLVDLWSGIEILLPILNKDSSDKINQIIDAIVPIITIKYFSKIITYILRAIKNSYKKKKIIQKLESIDPNHFTALVKCLTLQCNIDIYNQIINDLSDYPLLQKRIEYYQSKITNSEDILKIYKAHQTRVGWQIQRIYRARNLIVHSGETPYQIETLIENLHYYFDTIMTCISNEVSKSENYITLDHIYLKFKFKNNNYLKYLDKSKKSPINDDFIRKIILEV